MTQIRPGFMSAWNAFSEINVPVKDVGKKIGGKVQANIDSGVFKNACPIRISYVLNKCGLKIQRNSKYVTVSGAHNDQYIYRVTDIVQFLRDSFGKPEFTKTNPEPINFSNKKGIIVFSGSGWSNASGHVTLWSGINCSDACHFVSSPDNGSFIPHQANLWVLI